jgi:hypothetical protein
MHPNDEAPPEVGYCQKQNVGGGTSPLQGFVLEITIVFFFFFYVDPILQMAKRLIQTSQTFQSSHNPPCRALALLLFPQGKQ